MRLSLSAPPEFPALASSGLHLPSCPPAWLFFCTSRELKEKPISRAVCGKRLVGFRAAKGSVAVLDERCAHMGASLAQGEVVGDSLRCPFHHWEFDATGNCTKIPTCAQIPKLARQRAYPTRELHGCVFFYAGAEPEYVFPFFDGLHSDELSRAEPFMLELDCPWYMVGANGVDVQHFRTTHNRTLLEPPLVEHPHPFQHGVTTRFAVAGNSIRDRLTRAFAGPEVTMQVSDWGGTLFFVVATFLRTCTYGMVSLLPLERARTRVVVTVAVRKRGGWLGRLTDPIRARIRRSFVHAFLAPDVARAASTDVRRETLIDTDQPMREYFDWLESLYAADPPWQSVPRYSNFSDHTPSPRGQA